MAPLKCVAHHQHEKAIFEYTFTLPEEEIDDGKVEKCKKHFN